MGKYRNGLLIGTIALVIMLIASPATALPKYSSQFTTDTLDSSLNLEFVNIVAGKDLATYTNIFVFGGHDGSNMPVQDSAPGLAETAAWVLVYADLSGFDAHLNRIPFEAPDGLTLMLVYPQGVFDTFNKAGSAKALFDAEYGVSMDLAFFEGGSLQSDFYIFYSANDVFSSVATDVAGIDTNGFSNLMDASTVTSAPVGWAAYGARGLSSSRVAMSAMGWVDANGLTKTGDVYSLSSDHVLGADIVAASGFGLSRVQYSFPYPITPVTNGISPETSNPLPHVTGKMMWDVRHPISHYSLGDAVDYKVDYTISMDASFPNVQNRMSINQTKLNVDGSLEVLFELENIGGQEATDVTLSLPLGPDFGEIVDKNITIYTINDALYSLDENVEELFNLKMDTTPKISGITDNYNIDFQLFNLTGWYVYNPDNGSLADWDYATTSIILFDGTVNILGNPIDVLFEIYNPGGFPNALINAVNTHILADMPETSVADVLAHTKANLGITLRDTFQDSFDLFYQSEDKLIFDAGDFVLEQIEVGVNPAYAENRWFLTKTIPSMLPDATVDASFSLNEIPTTADTLALMEFSKGLTPDGYPTATLISEVQDYNQFMQYAFEAFGFDGRPISFNLPDDFTLDFDNLFTTTYGSMGMFFTYKNAAGFPFFGLSNGQNVQIADDEAVIAATVALDKQSYTVGDPVSITVDLINNGDIAATDIIIHLYHGTLGRDWQFERVDWIADISVDDLAAGASSQDIWNGEANSYLGYHTVFAFVEFISDKDQAAAELPDFLDLGITQFSAGAETKHFTMSTLSGGLLLPAGFLPEPSIPEPLLTMTTSIVGDDVNTAHLSAGEEFTYTVTIKNEGDAATEAAFVQTFDDSQLEVVSASSTEGTVTTGTRSVMVDGMSFAPQETITVTIVFKLKGNSATLPPGIVSYSVDGESSLGSSADTGFSINVSSAAASLLTVNADSAAQQESQKSGSQDSSSSAFSASSSVGANVATDDITESVITTDAVGFVGYGPEILGLMLIPLSIGVIAKRKRN